MKKQRYKDGLIFRLKLGESSYCYGRSVKRYNVVIYDFFDDGTTTDIEFMMKQPKLFFLMVNNYGFSDSWFEIIGHKKVEPIEITEFKPCFWQDDRNFENCILGYIDGRQDVPVKPEECIGLDYASVWGPEHVIKRVNRYIETGERFDDHMKKVRLK